MRNPTSRQRLWTLFVALLILVFGAGPSHAQDFEKVASELAARIHSAKHSRVTVVDFVDLDSKPSRLGKFMAQQLQLGLAEPKYKLAVVDQSQLSHLMDQIELLNEGLLDPATGQKLGQMAGTEVIILGSVMPSSMTIRVDIKAVDLATAKVITGATAKVARLPMHERLLAQDSPGAEAEITTAAAQPAAPAQKASRGPARTRRDLGVTFDMEGCSSEGGGLTCEMTVTSERDRWISVTFNSRAWSESGDEYGPGEIMIANSRSSRYCAAKQVLKNVPTRLSLSFPSFGGDTDFVERLRVQWAEQNDCCCYDSRPIDFEKIALSEYSDAPGRLGKAAKGVTEKGGKRAGGLLQRISKRVLDAAEDAAVKVIDQKTGGLVSDITEDDQKDN